MDSIHTRTYTNVALTAVILLLVTVLVAPHLTTRAAAVGSDLKEGSREVAAAQIQASAIREVAKSNQAIANAIKDSSKSQLKIASALEKFTQALTSDGGN